MKIHFYKKYKFNNFIIIRKKLLISIMVLLLLFIAFNSYSKFVFMYSPEYLWSSKDEVKNKNYIKWVDFSPTYTVLEKTAKLDIDSHKNNSEIKYNWIELLSYLACKYGGDFKKFKNKDLDKLIELLNNGEPMSVLTKGLKNYSYYYEAYDAVLHEFIGEDGLKVFHPIAAKYSYSHYDDFGNSRSYGYKRVHLGNDLMGSIRHSYYCC